MAPLGVLVMTALPRHTLSMTQGENLRLGTPPTTEKYTYVCVDR